MKLYSKVVMLVLLVILLSASGSAWGNLPSQDDIGTCLNQPDGSRITLPCEEIYRTGRSGRSFAIKEFCEPQPAHPRLVVVSTRSLPVSPYWTCDLSGVLSSISDTSRNGSAINQRVLVVSPENVLIYCDQKGRPFLFPPLKGLGIEWANKRSLAELAGESPATSSRASAMDSDSLPPMPDALDSVSAPVYCETVGDAKAEYAIGERNLVELQCRPFSSATSTQFTLGQDDPADSITVHYTGSGSLGTGRINKIVGTIQKDSGSNYWIEVNSGPNWQTGDFVGSVQTASEGTIAWAKTFADFATLPASLSGKVVSRTFPLLGYFYIQETARSSGIRVNDAGMASLVATGDTVDVEGELATDDGERVVNASSTTLVDLSAVASVGLNGRSLAGGSFNVFTPGAPGAYGLNNVGLLVRVWGRVTAVGSDHFYLDDGSDCDDGSGSSGVRVVNVSGFMPSVNDFIAATGVSGLATYGTNLARTVRLAHAVDLSGICPTLPPANLTIVPTGSGKLTLYWSGVYGATGYNVYRSTTSGGENYSAPLNGGTPVSAESYSGSGVFTYTNTALTDGVEYFYTVKAVGGCGESQASDEDSCVPDPNGAPWDTGDVAAILASIRSSFPGVSIPYGCIRARGPDGRDYLDGNSSPIIPDATINPTTRDVVFSDGTAIAAPNDIADIDSYLLGSMQILTTIEPRIKNAQSGPFRKVYTHHNYRGVRGRFRLPDSSVGIRVTPYTYPSTGRSTKDIPYVYLGGLGNRYTAVDAGLYWGPTANDSQSRWRMFGKIKNSKRDEWINTPPNGIFDDNQDVRAEFMTSSTINGRLLLKVTPDGGGQTGVITMDISDFPKTGQGVHLKRVHSIAQNNLIGTDKTNGYRRTGSYFQSSAWFEGQIMDQNGTYSNWGTSQTPNSTYHGRFPNSSSIVNFQLQFPQNLYPSKCFSGDLYVHITL